MHDWDYYDSSCAWFVKWTRQTRDLGSFNDLLPCSLHLSVNETKTRFLPRCVYDSHINFPAMLRCLSPATAVHTSDKTHKLLTVLLHSTIMKARSRLLDWVFNGYCTWQIVAMHCAAQLPADNFESTRQPSIHLFAERQKRLQEAFLFVQNFRQPHLIKIIKKKKLELMKLTKC